MAETAEQPITGLPKKTVTGITANDYLLGIDSAEGYQMLIQDLGNYIIQNATSSLMGSNQTLANALSTLNSKIADLNMPTSGTITDYIKARVSSGRNFGNFIADKSLSDSPESTKDFIILFYKQKGSNTVYVNAIANTDSRIQYTGRIYNYSDSAASLSGTWSQVPTRAEVDALNNRIKYVSKTITVPAGSPSSPSIVEIDFSEDIGSGSIYGLFASAGATPMPYVNNAGQVQTWIRSVGAKTAKIYEIGTGYSSRGWYFVLFIK